MIHGEKGSLGAAENILRESGFTISQTCRSRPSCFDFAARKDQTLVFVKTLPDMASLLPSDLQELRSISESFPSAPILIGEETRGKPLEDDTVYRRHGITAINVKTFENVMLRHIQPLIQANPGGYYVEIDGKALKQRRQKLGLSAREMADMIGISRRTIYGYEQGMAKASVNAAYNLIWTLGIPVAKPANILQKSRIQRKCCILTAARNMLSINRLLLKILIKFVRCHVTTVKKAPFDFVISVPDDRSRIIGGIANEKEPELSRRIDEILSIGKVIQAHPVLITEGPQPPGKDILCVSSSEVSRMKGPEDLIANIT